MVPSIKPLWKDALSASPGWHAEAAIPGGWYAPTAAGEIGDLCDTGDIVHGPGNQYVPALWDNSTGRSDKGCVSTLPHAPPA